MTVTNITTELDQRLSLLLADFYNREVTDEDLMAFALTNRDIWDGNEKLEPYTAYRIPDDPAAYLPDEYSTPTQTQQALLDALMQDSSSVQPVNEPVCTNPYTGGASIRAQCISEAIISRCLTYRPTRWLRPEFGTKLIDALHYNNVPELHAAIDSAVRLAVQPDADWYTVISITTRSLSPYSVEATVIAEGIGQAQTPTPVETTLSINLS